MSHSDFAPIKRLDSLPQLINVLLGEMSLVEPRPEVVEYVGSLSGPATDPDGTRRFTDWATLRDADEGALLAQGADPERMYVNHVLPEKARLQ